MAAAEQLPPAALEDLTFTSLAPPNFISLRFIFHLTTVGVEADCVEGLYNLGLVNLKLNSEQEAHNAFDKLHTILPRYCTHKC
jgi:hypothetical protein